MVTKYMDFLVRLQSLPAERVPSLDVKVVAVPVIVVQEKTSQDGSVATNKDSGVSEDMRMGSAQSQDMGHLFQTRRQQEVSQLVDIVDMEMDDEESHWGQEVVS